MPAVLLWSLNIAFAAMSYRDFVNVLCGPYLLDREQLCSIDNPDELIVYHAAIDADSVQPWFASEYTLGKEPYSMYALATVGGKKLLIQIPADHEGLRLTGTLGRFTRFEEQLLVPRFAALNPGQELLPFRLEATRPLWPVVIYGRVLPLAILGIVALRLTFNVNKRIGAFATCSSSGISSATAGRAGSASRPRSR
jgi:hypothetical protein